MADLLITWEHLYHFDITFINYGSVVNIENCGQCVACLFICLEPQRRQREKRKQLVLRAKQQLCTCNILWFTLLKLINNSLTKYKGKKCLMSVSKSDEKLLIFASLISLSKIILFVCVIKWWRVKLFPNFTSIPFDYLLISWVKNYVSNLGFLTCLSWIVSIENSTLPNV